MTLIIAATGDAVARLTAEDDGWSAVLSLAGSGTQCLALDTHHPGTIYAGSRGQGVWKSTDQGATWERLPFPQSDVFSLAVSAADGSVYAGCEPSMLFRSRDGGRTWDELEALRRIPSAPTWSFPPRPWTHHVRWIAPNPQDADLLLAGIELGGLMYSDDGGQTWLDHRPGAVRDVHALAWHPQAPGRAYEAGGGGNAWSRDGGLSWQPADAGRGDWWYSWGLAVDPEDPECWFTSASPGPREAHDRSGQGQAQIYRWRGDGPWEAVGDGLPQPLTSLPYALAITPDALYAGLGDGSLFVSHDRADHWQRLPVRGERISSIAAMAVG